MQGIADHALDPGAIALGDLADDGLDLQRTQVVRWGVHHVAGQGAGMADPPRRREVFGAIHHQPARLAFGPGLVAVEAIAPEAPGDGRLQS